MWAPERHWLDFVTRGQLDAPLPYSLPLKGLHCAHWIDALLLRSSSHSVLQARCVRAQELHSMSLALIQPSRELQSCCLNKSAAEVDACYAYPLSLVPCFSSTAWIWRIPQLSVRLRSCTEQHPCRGIANQLLFWSSNSEQLDYAEQLQIDHFQSAVYFVHLRCSQQVGAPVMLWKKSHQC